MTDPLHVAPGIVGFLDAPNHVRIRAIRTERWIGFGRARRVVEHLSALCEYPPSTRPPGLAIYGHSGMGKTMLVEKLRRRRRNRRRVHFRHRHRNLEARNRKGGRFRLTALQNWHSN
ncbi:MAG TPA: TniB family NTP-binding protein [Stellaceae bacterium]|nr:TniB family NTP-binding protein [Stellaceae bacterium]